VGPRECAELVGRKFILSNYEGGVYIHRACVQMWSLEGQFVNQSWDPSMLEIPSRLHALLCSVYSLILLDYVRIWRLILRLTVLGFIVPCARITAQVCMEDAWLCLAPGFRDVRDMIDPSFKAVPKLR
jgi:hypothetical protein